MGSCKFKRSFEHCLCKLSSVDDYAKNTISARFQSIVNMTLPLFRAKLGEYIRHCLKTNRIKLLPSEWSVEGNLCIAIGQFRFIVSLLWLSPQQVDNSCKLHTTIWIGQFIANSNPTNRRRYRSFAVFIQDRSPRVWSCELAFIFVV